MTTLQLLAAYIQQQSDEVVTKVKSQQDDEAGIEALQLDMLKAIATYLQAQDAMFEFGDVKISPQQINWSDEAQVLGAMGLLAENDDAFSQAIRPLFYDSDEFEFWGLLRTFIHDSKLI